MERDKGQIGSRYVNREKIVLMQSYSRLFHACLLFLVFLANAPDHRLIARRVIVPARSSALRNSLETVTGLTKGAHPGKIVKRMADA
jgi:hypothetical protein